jgi:hypothetical protein
MPKTSPDEVRAAWPFSQPLAWWRKSFRPGHPGNIEPTLSFDSHADTTYAHRDPAFSGVLHVFVQTWLGIRAAAGSLPGRKLAIAQNSDLTGDELRTLREFIGREGITRIVLHGYSPSATGMIDDLANAGLGQMIHLVYHGNIAQWHDRTERSFALKAIAAAEAGKIRRLHILQRDHGFVGERAFGPMLFNPAPRHAQTPTAPRRRDDTVFVPGSDSWRKNLHVNALGAALTPRISRVIHYAGDIDLPPPCRKKLRQVSYLDRASTFGLMARVGCTLAVSLVECHPMVGVESESLGTPCLRGPLHLDHGEDHPYVRLVKVENPLSPREVSQRLDHLLSVPVAERTALVADYTAMMNSIALARYREFLDLS